MADSQKTPPRPVGRPAHLPGRSVVVTAHVTPQSAAALRHGLTHPQRASLGDTIEALLTRQLAFPLRMLLPPPLASGTPPSRRHPPPRYAETSVRLVFRLTPQTASHLAGLARTHHARVGDVLEARVRETQGELPAVMRPLGGRG